MLDPALSAESQCEDLRPDEWVYLAEGNLHVLLAYRGQCARFRDHVLRLLKVRHGGEKKALYDPRQERHYVEHVVGPVLGHQYLETGTSLTVTPSFLNEVAIQIMPHRPARRAVYDLDKTACTVECLRDLTRFFPPMPHATLTAPPTCQLTLEIKPKAGYHSRSRLVPPARRFKFQESRFSLMQRYRFAVLETQALEPEWGDLREGPNWGYSPPDLFSGEVEKMTRTLQALIRNPQIFFQFFVGPRLVYGRGERQVGLARNAARQLLLPGGACAEGFGAESEEDPLDTLMEAVAQVLQQECLLPRLLSLQRLDVLDVEGAGAVMERLVELCGGEEAAAQALLQEEVLQARLLRTGAEEEGPGGESMSAMARRLEAALGLGPCGARGGSGKGSTCEGEPAGFVLEQQHKEALATVQRLSQAECLFLLHRWLIALGASDCSIMLAIRRCPDEAALPLTRFSPVLGQDASSLQPLESFCQSASEPGLLSFRPTPPAQGGRERGAVRLAYAMHVVDLGPKPPTKVLSKARLEDGIIAAAQRAGSSAKEASQRSSGAVSTH
ncbi:inositol-pentakisphosphate 2-kinase-like protein [Nannochloropsis gaditana]|uniref:Inositol-pentakisphosphate 2-kinase n=3 Tax=Nannochloropsis gaditana TaxID=72520 RepID=W7T6N2_9STRA|nr:inositol-pentakisphosphate 2-kinase-like protein [Nannochloropsis gaditana]